MRNTPPSNTHLDDVRHKTARHPYAAPPSSGGTVHRVRTGPRHHNCVGVVVTDPDKSATTVQVPAGTPDAAGNVTVREADIVPICTNFRVDVATTASVGKRHNVLGNLRRVNWADADMSPFTIVPSTIRAEVTQPSASIASRRALTVADAPRGFNLAFDRPIASLAFACCAAWPIPADKVIRARRIRERVQPGRVVTCHESPAPSPSPAQPSFARFFGYRPKPRPRCEFGCALPVEISASCSRTSSRDPAAPARSFRLANLRCEPRGFRQTHR